MFVSSTFDLKAERRAIEDELRGFPYKVFLYEDEPALPTSGKDHCLWNLGQSRLVVLLAGPRYGSVVPATQPKSVTEWEFETARSKPLCLPVFGFIRDDAFHSTDESQRDFVARLQGFEGGVSRGTFKTTAELKSKVGRALHRWNLDFRLAREGPRRQIAEAIMKLVTQLMIVTVIAFLLAMTLWELDRTVLLTVCVLLVVALLGGLALVQYLRKDQ